MNRKLVGALLLGGVLMVSPGLAIAAKSVSAKLTIAATRTAPFSGYLLSGTLSSSDKACVKGRVVKVYLRRATDRSYSETGRATATSSGKWALPKKHPVTPGKYYAKVDKKGSCKAAKSKTIIGSAYY